MAGPSSSGPRPTGAVMLETLGPQMIAVVWVLVALSGIFLGLRIYCKFLKSRGLWWDDYLLIASWVSLCLRIPRANG